MSSFATRTVGLMRLKAPIIVYTLSAPSESSAWLGAAESVAFWDRRGALVQGMDFSLRARVEVPANDAARLMSNESEVALCVISSGRPVGAAESTSCSGRERRRRNVLRRFRRI